ncbi:MAG: hypothetical protein WC457_00135 [Patescibacteria group bacterium]
MTEKKSKTKTGGSGSYDDYLVRGMQGDGKSEDKENVVKQIFTALKRRKEMPPEKMIEAHKNLVKEISGCITEMMSKKAQLLSQGGEVAKLAEDCEKLRSQAEALLAINPYNEKIDPTENLKQLKEYADTYKKIKKQMDKAIVLVDAEVQKYNEALEAEKKRTAIVPSRVEPGEPKEPNLLFDEKTGVVTFVDPETGEEQGLSIKKLLDGGVEVHEMIGNKIFLKEAKEDPRDVTAEIYALPGNVKHIVAKVFLSDTEAFNNSKSAPGYDSPAVVKRVLEKYFVDERLAVSGSKPKKQPAITIDVSIDEPAVSKKIDNLASHAPTVMVVPEPKEPTKPKAEKFVLENGVAKIGKTEFDLSPLVESGNYDLVYNESDGTIVIKNKINPDHAARIWYDQKVHGTHLEQNVPSDADVADGKTLVEPITDENKIKLFADKTYETPDDLLYALRRLFPELRPVVKIPYKFEKGMLKSHDFTWDLGNVVSDGNCVVSVVDGNTVKFEGKGERKNIEIIMKPGRMKGEVELKKIVDGKKEFDQLYKADAAKISLERTFAKIDKIDADDQTVDRAWNERAIIQSEGGVWHNVDDIADRTNFKTLNSTYENGVMKADDISIDLSALEASGQYDFQLNSKNGRLKIQNKANKDLSAGIRYIGDGIFSVTENKKTMQSYDEEELFSMLSRLFPEFKGVYKKRGSAATPPVEPSRVSPDEEKIATARVVFADKFFDAKKIFEDEVATVFAASPNHLLELEAHEAIEHSEQLYDDALEHVKDIKDADEAQKYLFEQLEIIKKYIEAGAKTLKDKLNTAAISSTADTLPSTPPPSPEPVKTEPPEIGSEVDLAELELYFAEEARLHNEKIVELTDRLEIARVNFTNAFLEKEKYGGAIGGIKKLFSRKSTLASVQDKYDTAWNEYAVAQRDLAETSKKQAEILRDYLSAEQQSLQKQIMEVRGKGKMEKIGKGVRQVEKGWRKLGELNAYNGFKAAGANVDSWNVLARTALKAMSVRTVISGACLAGGFSGIVPLAAARVAMSGFGGMTGSRQLMDGIQNSIQRRWGNRGDFFSDKKTAEEYLKNKFNILDLGVDDKATAKRRAKMEKELAQTDKFLKQYDNLDYSEKLEKVQERIASIEAAAFFDGVDLNKDENYQRLTETRDRLADAYIDSKARESGDFEQKVRPDDLKDMLVYLDTRKTEMDLTLKKMSQEKWLRGGKRLVSIAAGAALGAWSFVRFAKHAAEMAAGVNISSPSETVVHTINAGNAVPATEQISPELQSHLDQFGDNQTLREAFLAEAQAHHGQNLDKIADAYVVHKGDGLERIIQRQLLLDPEKFGMDDQNILGDPTKLQQWAGHEARVIALKNHIDDKYFVYDAKHPQYLVVDENKHVIYETKQLHTETEAMRAHRAGVETRPFAPTEDAPRQVFELKPGHPGGVPKLLTDSEQAEYNRLVDQFAPDEAMKYLMDHKDMGPVYELPDGTETHEQNLVFDTLAHGSAASTRESVVNLTEQPEGADSKIVVPVANGQSPSDVIDAETMKNFEANQKFFGQFAEKQNIASAEAADAGFGKAKFEYANGHVSNVKIDQDPNLTLEKVRPNILRGDAGSNFSSTVSQNIINVGSIDSVYRGLLNQGLENSEQAEALRKEAAAGINLAAGAAARSPIDIFSADVLERYGFKDEAGFSRNQDALAKFATSHGSPLDKK